MTPPFPKPKVAPPLDRAFVPAVLVHRHAVDTILASGDAAPLILALERDAGQISVYDTVAFVENSVEAGSELRYVERLLKFLLWQRGAHTVYVAGPRHVVQHLAQCYSPSGPRAFDVDFLGRQVYDQTFRIVACPPDAMPRANERTLSIGGHLEGCRIGFDLGASDRKVSALIDGKVVFSNETVWEPRKHADPQYHYAEIRRALQEARKHLSRLDAIGGSSAGIFIDNQPRVASLFREVPPEQFHLVRNLFLRIEREFGVPLTVINDGDVTALAGAMALEDTGVLGIALGSSEAAGYVGMDGNLTGWLNELAFAPVDYSPDAPVEGWSGDLGVGASYLSQQCVFRLAEGAGVALPNDTTDAGRLEAAQALLESGHEGALKIWQTMGVYLGYALALYADFCEIKHVLILGRCTSGRGGAILLEHAWEVLHMEFPELAARIKIQLPDEKTRRVGQSIAAASLPAIQRT